MNESVKQGASVRMGACSLVSEGCCGNRTGVLVFADLAVSGLRCREFPQLDTST